MSPPSTRLVRDFELSLRAAATGDAPWRPALESLLLLGRTLVPGESALFGDALQRTSAALAMPRCTTVPDGAAKTAAVTRRSVS